MQRQSAAMDSSHGGCTSGKCICETVESDCSQESSPTFNKEKKRLSLNYLGFNLRRGRSLQFKTKRSKKSHGSPESTSSTASTSSTSTKKSPKWPLKFNCAKRESRKVQPQLPPSDAPSCCRCMCYRRTEEHHLGAGVVFDTEDKLLDPIEDLHSEIASVQNQIIDALPVDLDEPPVVVQEPIRDAQISANSIYGHNRVSGMLLGPLQIPMDLNWMRAIHEDCDEAARRQRAKEMEQGVDPPANYRPARRVQLLCTERASEDGVLPHLRLVCPSDLSVESLRALFQNNVTLRSCNDPVPGCHTQVHFIHCLVPDLLTISNCIYYWGKMDRYEAERLLDGKPEGTFLLRDSAQEEYLFSVSFRKYGRSLHARIEQWNHMFSFDSHDPGVYTSNSVCGLVEHYKDPSSCMFFEPMLTWPLHRKTTFSLQHLCRAVITSQMTYDNVNKLQLPKTLKGYLREYHYRQKVRVERFDDDVQCLDLNVQLPQPQ